MTRFLFCALLLLTGMVLGPADAGQAAVIPLEIEDLARGATWVLRGNVVEARSSWTEDDTMIYTRYRVRVTDAIVGELPQEIEIKVPGGQIDGIRITNGEAPVYTEGEDIVAFLCVDPSASQDRVTYGWFQGKLTLVGGYVREMVNLPYSELRHRIVLAANK